MFLSMRAFHHLLQLLDEALQVSFGSEDLLVGIGILSLSDDVFGDAGGDVEVAEGMLQGLQELAEGDDEGKVEVYLAEFYLDAARADLEVQVGHLFASSQVWSSSRQSRSSSSISWIWAYHTLF